MLRFKQFISVYLTEAKAEHFAHIGLDVNDPHHRDMLDMFNKHTHMLSKKNPNQYKSLEELHAAVKPHLDELTRQREDEHQQQQALQSGDAELVHHDPETGVKVFKVKSGKGCRAVGSDTKWCTAEVGTGDTAFRGYDPEGEHSYVIHTPEKGNLSKIGIIGIKPYQQPKFELGGNFQDKGNNSVSNKDWEMLRKKYNLDNVQHLEGIRGIPISEKTKNKNSVKSQELTEKIKFGKHTEKDLQHAIENNYLTKEHVNEVGDIGTKYAHGRDILSLIAEKSDDPEVLKAISAHKNASLSAFYSILNKSNDPEVHKAIVNNKNTTERDTFYQVAKKSNDPEVHKAILNHQIITTPHYESLPTINHIAGKTSDPEVLKNILKFKHINTNTLRNITYGSGKNVDIQKSIISHDACTADNLRDLAEYSNNPEILKAIAAHKKTDNNVLGNIINNYNDPEIHKTIVNRDDVGDNILNTISLVSRDVELHKSIVNHKNIGKQTLSTLSGKYKTNPDRESILKEIKIKKIIHIK